MFSFVLEKQENAEPITLVKYRIRKNNKKRTFFSSSQRGANKGNKI